MVYARGASNVGTVIAVALLAVTTGSTVYLGVRHQRIAEANRALAASCSALELERDQRTREVESLAAQRQADQAEITRLRENAAEKAAAVATLRDQISSLETRATTLQDEINKARSDGTLKETRIAELRLQLDETKGNADKAQGQLRILGYTKDELNDQVAKLQTRLSGSQTELDAARQLAQEQQKTITALHTDLSATKVETVVLRQTAADLKRELDLRPRPSVGLEADAYRPSRDRKVAKTGAS